MKSTSQWLIIRNGTDIVPTSNKPTRAEAIKHHEDACNLTWKQALVNTVYGN